LEQKGRQPGEKKAWKLGMSDEVARITCQLLVLRDSSLTTTPNEAVTNTNNRFNAIAALIELLT